MGWYDPARMVRFERAPCTLARQSVRSAIHHGLPDCINQWTKMEFIAEISSELTSVPDSIANMTSLTDIDFEGNRISNLPDLSALLNLCNVDCARNQLHLPAK
jgi:Leucine-rich repeat (LRR) protein